MSHFAENISSCSVEIVANCHSYINLHEDFMIAYLGGFRLNIQSAVALFCFVSMLLIQIRTIDFFNVILVAVYVQYFFYVLGRFALG